MQDTRARYSRSPPGRFSLLKNVGSSPRLSRITHVRRQRSRTRRFEDTKPFCSRSWLDKAAKRTERPEGRSTLIIPTFKTYLGRPDYSLWFYISMCEFWVIENSEISRSIHRKIIKKKKNQKTSNNNNKIETFLSGKRKTWSWLWMTLFPQVILSVIKPDPV